MTARPGATEAGRERVQRMLADHLSDMVGYWDTELRCVFANAAYRQWFGWDPDALVGQRMPDLLGPTLFALNEPHVRGALAGQPQQFERALTDADGSLRHTWAQYIPDIDGELVRGFLVLVSDITVVKETQLALAQQHRALQAELEARLQTESRLSASQTSYRLLFDNMLNGFVHCRLIFDDDEPVDFQYVEVNRAYEAMTGLRNVEGRRESEVGPPFNRPRSAMLEALARVVRSGDPERFEAFRNSDKRWLDVSLSRPSPGHAFIIFDDITERKRAYAELEQANAALAVRTREAEAASLAKSQFLSSVNHELRTPLHTLLGYVQLLTRRAEGDTLRQLQAVERSGVQLQRLINDLLQFSVEGHAQSALQPRAIARLELVEELAALGRSLAAGTGNSFGMDVDADLPTSLWLDRERLVQVLENLLSNACKYTRNGQVSLVMTTAPLAALPADHCRLHFTVLDTGEGIDEADQQRIFGPFQRGSNVREQPGLGLGLAIAQHWVQAMGGKISVHSALRQGSRFSFALDLPAESPQAPPPASAQGPRPLPPREGPPPRVLVVDDMASNRDFLRDLCEHWGYAVLEADGAEAALAICRADPLGVDAVLVDQFMPGKDGWALLRDLRQTPGLQQLPMALISASPPQRPPDLALEVAFDITLGKPLDIEALSSFLCRAVGLIEPHRVQGAQEMHDAATPAPPAVLSAKDLATLRDMLNLGRTFAIEDWAQALVEREPTLAPWAERLRTRCRMADLTGLEAMLAAVLTR